jgi:hypothetical protein
MKGRAKLRQARPLSRHGILLAILGVAAAGLATGATTLPAAAARAHADGRVERVDHLVPARVVNLSQLASRPSAAAPRVQHYRVGALSSRAGVGTASPAAVTGPFGGDSAPASSVVSGGDNFDFNGISNLDMESGGTGNYAGTQPTLEPPDQGLCTNAGAPGDNFVMETVNDALRVYKTDGSPMTAGSVPLAQFLSLNPNGLTSTELISDPRCLYDHATQRWFFTVLSATEPTTAEITDDNNYIAVSKTSDPNGSWFIYNFDVLDNGLNGTPVHVGCQPVGTDAPLGGCLGDQPTIGADQNGIYITDNEYSLTEVLPVPPPVSPPLQRIPGVRSGVAQLYALSKQQLISGTSTTLVRFDTGDPINGVPFPGSPVPSEDAPWQSISPAQPVAGDTTPAVPNGVEYFLSDVGLPTGHNANQIVVWAWLNTASLSSSPSLTLQHVIINTLGSDSFFFPDPSPPANQGPFYAYQKTGPDPVASQAGDSEEVLNADDDRMNWVFLSNGSLWSGVNTELSPTNASGSNPHASDNRVGIMYFQAKPAIVGGNLQATMARDGYIQVPDNNVLFPSIGPRADGATIVTFTLAGADYYPSLAFARIDGLASGQGPVVHIARPGAAPEDGFTGVGLLGQQGLPDVPSCTLCVARWGDYSATQVDENGCIWGAAEDVPTGNHEPPITFGPVSVTFTDWGTGIYEVCPPPIVSTATPEVPWVPALVSAGLAGAAVLAGVRRKRRLAATT